VHPKKRLSIRAILPMLVALLAISGCSNSKLFISPVYNRLDDQMRKEFNKLGDFNKEQVDAFEQRLGTYHVWHRQSELPQYSNLLRTIAGSIAKANVTSKEDVSSWVETSETFTKALRECHPVNYSYDLMKTLTDEQLNFIQRRFGRERKKNREKYFAQTPEQRVERRYNNILKWTGRLDFEFTERQKVMLKETMQEQVSLRKEYYKLSDRWNRQLFLIAKRQELPSYNKDMDAHIQSLWSLLEDGHTVEWQTNRTLWKNFGLKFVDSMTGDQRKKASIWLTRLAKTLDSISQDEPSFKVTNDPNLGCLVN